MLQFQSGRGNFKKDRLQRLQIGQDGDDPAIRKLFSQFHGNPGIGQKFVDLIRNSLSQSEEVISSGPHTIFQLDYR